MKSNVHHRGRLKDNEIEETISNIRDQYSWEYIRNTFQHNYGRRLTRDEAAYLKDRAAKKEPEGK
jgi:hypothetical protein